jgi:hypothetical protein
MNNGNLAFDVVLVSMVLALSIYGLFRVYKIVSGSIALRFVVSTLLGCLMSIVLSLLAALVLTPLLPLSQIPTPPGMMPGYNIGFISIFIGLVMVLIIPGALIGIMVSQRGKPEEEQPESTPSEKNSPETDKEKLK